MSQTSDSINIIIQELVNPSLKLKDTLLKVQVLASKIKSKKLKEWVENELNSYNGKEVPKYRIIPTNIFGNLEQDRGFGGMMTRNNQLLPIEYLYEELRNQLMTLEIRASVAELQNMIDSEGDYKVTIPHLVHSEITKILTNNWVVNSAWYKISLNSIHGILDSVKSNLLTFLLELADELGEQDNLNIMEHKNKIDDLFTKTIGNLSGETVNISIGTNNQQTVNTGDNSQLNIAKGEAINQNTNYNFKEELGKVINDLNSKLNDIPMRLDDKKDIQNEILRIETQLGRETPRFPIINESIKTITGILIGVTANIWTPTIIYNLNQIAAKLHF